MGAERQCKDSALLSDSERVVVDINCVGSIFQAIEGRADEVIE